VDPATDPGWGPARADAFLLLIPLLRRRRLKKRSSAGDGLTVLRGYYLSYVMAIGMIGCVVVILETTAAEIRPSSEVFPLWVVVVAVGFATLAASRVVTPPLPCESESDLAAGYRQRFFLQIAFANVAALTGFMGVIMSAAGWMYPLGALFTAIGFAKLAPTAGNLRQDQEDLRRRGCTVSLMSALQLSESR